jgi:hypothetical protein
LSIKGEGRFQRLRWKRGTTLVGKRWAMDMRSDGRRDKMPPG